MNPIILLLAVVMLIIFPTLGDACGAIINVAILYCVIDFFWRYYKNDGR